MFKMIEEKVRADRDITIKRLSAETGLKRSAIMNIIVKKLNAKKLKPILNPHKLTPELMKERKNWCKKMLKRIKKKSRYL